MTEFLKPNLYAHVTAGILAGLRRRVIDGVELERVRDFYEMDVKVRMLESGLYNHADLLKVTIHSDGTATDAEGGLFSGAPSWAEFIEYIREGRK